MAKKLDVSEVSARLTGLPGWAFRGGKLHREFRFHDFAEAFAFMTRVAAVAERHAHHPDWSNAYNRLTIDLWTHDAGGVTDLDCALAEAISRLWNSC